MLQMPPGGSHDRENEGRGDSLQNVRHRSPEKKRKSIYLEGKKKSVR